jgi:hypothetical protein
MPLSDQIDRRGHKRRVLTRKEAGLQDARAHEKRLVDNIASLERKRARFEAEGRKEELTQRIARLKRELERVRESIRELEKLIPDIRQAIRRLSADIQRRRRERRQRRKRKIDTSPYDPHWGGSEDILRREVLPVAASMGFARHSGKRDEDYGNPGSDHHVSQPIASAGDFPPSISLAVAIAKRLGIGYRGYADDYKLYYIQRDGHTYRVQIIASNHGTGPHVHVGIARVS